MSDIAVKICGLSRPEHVTAAAEAGASYVGYVFFPKSPRNVSLDTARALAIDTPPGVAKVALVVNADDAFLDALTAQVPLDMLQLHGRESPARVAEVKARYGLPVMKVVGVATEADLPAIDEHARVADMLLIEPKPAPDAYLFALEALKATPSNVVAVEDNPDGALAAIQSGVRCLATPGEFHAHNVFPDGVELQSRLDLAHNLESADQAAA